MEQETTWQVVKFLQENSVEAVPSNWINGDKCYWPPYNNTKRVQQATIKREPPVPDLWKSYDVYFFRNNVFDNYETALKKARKATITSDLESDDNLPPKRRRILKKFSSTSSIEYEETVLPQPPEPPQLYKGVNNHLTILCTIIYYINGWILELLTKVLQKQNTMSGILSTINEKLKKLEDNNIPATSTIKEFQSVFTKFDFPINDEMILNNFENFLKNEDEFDAVVREFSRLGGTNEYNLITRILEKVITNKLASTFSYLGKKQKKPFKNLLLNKVIIKVGTTVFSAKTELPFENAVAKWLRRAKERKDKTTVAD
ncbi:hypothetical protein RI129_006414 [Pyrocoelia pectoralis]|uniref:DUF4806 domain-containing protein n=1 Tax=Pyrocoelia pectoralis TaxID=417401 RepID=A0AAN7VF95_9COLE